MQDQNRTSRVLIGESFVGEGAEAAHVNTVLGGRDGPVGTAWATALAMPRPGHAAFVTILRPNLPVKPLTLFVNKAAMADERHGDLTWGAAQAGVAGGACAGACWPGPAASNFLERGRAVRAQRPGDYDDSFALALACKDLGLAVDLADHAGVPAEVSAVVEQVYRRARAQYGDAGGEMLPIKLYEDLTRTPLRLR